MTPSMFAAFAAMCLAAPPAPPGKVSVARSDEATHFYVDGELAASYNHGPNCSKPYFWPLYAPGNIPLTRGWPMEVADVTRDLPHHKSAWIGHGDVIPEGFDIVPKVPNTRGIDFWSEQPGHGIIACTTVSISENQPGRAEARTSNVWKTINGRAVLDEERYIELYNLGNARLFLITCTFKPAGIPVTFGDTTEGMFGVRVNDQLRVGDKAESVHRVNAILNSAGQRGEAECFGKAATWCDFSGNVNSRAAGITLMEDPANKSHARWLVRNNGLMAANPFGRFGTRDAPAPVRLKPGEQLTLRYGLLLRSGDATVADGYRKFLALLP